MNAERLLELYDRIVDAPDAIARLRRFILDLAVRGKLVEQDPKDEPASGQLKRIAAEKALLDRKSRTKRETREFHGDPTTFELPRGWAAAPLADLVSVLNGRAYKQNELLQVGTPVLRVGNLFTSDKWYYSNLELDEDKYCEKGDLIFAWSASFGPFIWEGERSIFHYHIWKLPLFSEAALDKKFLYNFLLQKTREIKEAGHGISMVHMTKEKMELIEVPLAPLAEQRRIVAKVDELMALCDRLEAARAKREATRDRLAAASLTRLNAPDPDPFLFADQARFALDNLAALAARPDQIKQIRQTILNLAVRGKLVPQNASDGTGGDLLKAVKKAREAWEDSGRVRKERQSGSAIDLAEKYLDLPPSWTWARIFELGHTQTGTSPSSGNRDLFGDFIPFIKPGNLDGNEIEYEGPGLSEVGIDHSRLAPAGSVLMVCIGATLGKVNRTTQPICFNQQINSVTPFLDGLSDFVALALKASNFQALAWSKAGTGTLPIISKGKWEILPIPVPPLAEQHRIVKKVDALMALCDQLEASLTATDATRRRLLESLLAEALEPASVRELDPAE
jgi:type I restriction enzyme S subunit